MRTLNGTPDEVLDELTNVAYVISKEIKNHDGVKTWIVWMLAKYLNDPKAPLIDRRINIRRSSQMSPLHTAIINEEKELLMQSLKRLDKKKLNMLSLRYVNNMQLWKIGACYGVSRTHVANELRKIINDIKKEMEK